jgi:hypothetical protein
MKNLTLEDINEIMEVIEDSIEIYWSEFDKIKAALIAKMNHEPESIICLGCSQTWCECE